MFRPFGAALSLVLLPAGLAQAGSLDQPAAEPMVYAQTAPAPVAGPQLRFTLRAGAAVAPSYFGSDDVTVGPDFGFSIGYLKFGGLEFGNPDPNAAAEGLGFRGSFRYIPERTAEDYPELTGIDDVDLSVELGGGVTYTTALYQVFADVRYGVVGHESFVGEVGADLYYRPNDRLTLRAGPRAFFGSDDYAQTYFGIGDVAPAEGGLLSAGVEVGAHYDLTEVWGVDAAVRWDRLQNDAADSAISMEDDQYSARIGVTRVFDIRF